MEGSAKYFNGDVPYVVEIDGEINGQKFRVEGKGTGNSEKGFQKGKFVCVSGKLPLAWAALAPTLGYGNKVFVKYPNGMTNYFQQCMPEGYIQDREHAFEGDGTLKIHQEITMDGNTVINKAKLVGTGFAAGSPILNGKVSIFLPTVENTFPFEDGIKSLSNHVYPLKGGDGFIVAQQVTVNKPLGNKQVKIPNYHLKSAHIQHLTDSAEEKDHVIQQECEQAYELCML